MASDYTTHYHLDKYVATDKPNLRDQYNSAMDKIDNQLLTASVDAAEAKQSVINFRTELDEKASIEQLQQAVAPLASKTEVQNAVAPLATTAQLTALSQVVATKADESDIADFITKDLAFSKADVRLYGAIENTACDWGEILTTCKANSDIVYFPAGTWLINTTLDFDDGKIIRVVGDGAILKATASLTYIMKFSAAKAASDAGPHVTTCVQGIVFDCNSTAESALQLNSAGCNVYMCAFKNFAYYGINDTHLGLYASACTFGDDRAQYQNTSVGIKTLSDSCIFNCRFYGLGTCVICRGETSIIGNLFWVGDKASNPAATAIEYDTTVLTGRTHVSIIGNEFDTMPISFKNIGASTIIGNHFFWNNSIMANIPFEITLFYFIGNPSVGDCIEFSYNGIKCGNRVWRTYKTNLEVTRVFARFTSRNNAIQGNITNLRIGYGVIYTTGNLDDGAMYYGHFKYEHPNIDQNPGVYTLEYCGGTWGTVLIGMRTRPNDMAFDISNIRKPQNILQYVKYLNNSEVAVGIPLGAMNSLTTETNMPMEITPVLYSDFATDTAALISAPSTQYSVTQM